MVSTRATGLFVLVIVRSVAPAVASGANIAEVLLDPTTSCDVKGLRRMFFNILELNALAGRGEASVTTVDEL